MALCLDSDWICSQMEEQSRRARRDLLCTPELLLQKKSEMDFLLPKEDGSSSTNPRRSGSGENCPYRMTLDVHIVPTLGGNIFLPCLFIT